MAWEFSSEALVDMLDYLDTLGLYVAAHTADPTATGIVGEVTGGTYARQACTYAAATGSGGTATMALSASPSIPIPGTPTTVSWLSVWQDISSTSQADFVGRVDIGDETFSSDGNLEVTTLTLAMDQVPA